jgi:acyl-CoA reductase-like NAD-dependent aldehyde dehydrogenase
VINVLAASREASEALVRDPRVDLITFTGSTAVGRRIATIMGERIGRTVLELGGKSAAIVLDDYDVETAAKAIAPLAVMLTGQACSSLTRIIVSRSRHDELAEALQAVFESVVVGDAHASTSGMGPLATEQQRARVEGYIAAAQAEGCTLVSGGKRPAHLARGFFVEPTIFSNVENRSTIAAEEIFGPVLSVIPADNDEHAIELANDTIYGLNNSVFTHDADRAYAVSRRLRSGTVGHNMYRTDFGITAGGFKQSGIGREGIVEGIHEFLESKAIILDEEPTFPVDVRVTDPTT